MWCHIPCSDKCTWAVAGALVLHSAVQDRQGAGKTRSFPLCSSHLSSGVCCTQTHLVAANTSHVTCNGTSLAGAEVVVPQHQQQLEQAGSREHHGAIAGSRCVTVTASHPSGGPLYPGAEHATSLLLRTSLAVTVLKPHPWILMACSQHVCFFARKRLPMCCCLAGHDPRATRDVQEPLIQTCVTACPHTVHERVGLSFVREAEAALAAHTRRA